MDFGKVKIKDSLNGILAHTISIGKKDFQKEGLYRKKINTIS